MRGIASNGRIYPPISLTVTAGSPRVGASMQNSARDAGKALLSAINQPTGGTFAIAPCVVSRGANGGLGAGALELITSVRVGNVVDVQRRRKNALKESYVSANWP